METPDTPRRPRPAGAKPTPKTDDLLQTEYPFTLPKGYVDSAGTRHRTGTMRLATAIDEIAPLRDPRVRNNPDYLTIILLARVITRLGTVSDVNPGLVEGLFSADFAYLQDLYRRINEPGKSSVDVECPECHHAFAWEVPPLGE